MSSWDLRLFTLKHVLSRGMINQGLLACFLIILYDEMFPMWLERVHFQPPRRAQPIHIT